MNSLYQQLQNPMQQPRSPQPSQKLSTPQTKNNFLSQFLNSSNPKEFIQNMVMNNPKMQSVLQLFQNSNLTPKQFFYQYAQQQGVDPDQFINSLK